MLANIHVIRVETEADSYSAKILVVYVILLHLLNTFLTENT